MKLFDKIRLAAALAKIALGGKHGKALEKIEGGIEIAEKVKELVRPPKAERKKA